MIRHTEVCKVPITKSARIDYLFHRAFAMVQPVTEILGRSG